MEKGKREDNWRRGKEKREDNWRREEGILNDCIIEHVVSIMYSMYHIHIYVLYILLYY